MQNMKEYMQRNGVSKKKYVLKWIQDNKIPGVTKDSTTGEYVFPDSARRPYSLRCQPNANASRIRAHIIKACVERKHIMCSMFSMTNQEFEAIIDDLEKKEYIHRRSEDGIIYYDSTIKSDEYKRETIRQIEMLLKAAGFIVTIISPMVQAS